uniref:ATP synthase subunits region ORF 7 n=1 Tax=Magallana gigas TaxID=29159 RepID=K1QJK7_MAGGI
MSDLLTDREKSASVDTIKYQGGFISLIPAYFIKDNCMEMLSSQSESGTVTHYGFKPTAKWPHSRKTTFKSSFDGTPTLTYGLYTLDVSNGANTRVDTVVTNLSRTGFQLTLRTWANTELYGAYVSWMACGK